MSSARSMIGVTISWYANRVATSAAARSVARHSGRSRGRMSRTPRTALIGSERGMVFDGSRSSRNDRGDQGAARLVSLARMPSNPIAIVQLASLILAALALIMGAYLLIIGKRPWREAKDERVAPRVRLLGLSYILVFGSAMIQIVLEPRGLEGELLGGLMVLGGMIVIVVVFLESRASRRSALGR